MKETTKAIKMKEKMKNPTDNNRQNPKEMKMAISVQLVENADIWRIFAARNYRGF